MGFLAISRERLRLARMRRRLEQQPKPHGIAELARSYLELGADPVARKLLDFGQSLFPRSTELKRVRTLFVDERHRDHLSAAKESVREMPTAPAYLELADAYRSAGKEEQYSATLREMLEQFGENCSALTQLGEVRMRRFVCTLAAVDGVAAERLFLHAAATDVEALKPRFLLADLYFRVGARQHAARVIDELLALAPAHERAAMMRAALTATEAPESVLEEDFRSLLAEVEEGSCLAGSAPPWEKNEFPPTEQSAPVALPDSELRQLQAESGATQVILLGEGGRRWGSDGDSPLRSLCEGLSAFCQRAARGMELGVPARLVVEGDEGALALELKRATLVGLVLPKKADVRKAVVLARDALERLVGD